MNNREFHKSSYSDHRGGNCVEVAEGTRTLIRDTQNRDLATLEFPASEWAAFLRDVN